MNLRRTNWKMINSISIHGFRGIHELDIPSLKRVNLVVGDNNCGKTS
ncbi:MAG: AAA family ATPase, partial [Victivallales bacterium]|nr:AAA family ATPase [Victivallales bacterium]